MSGKLIHVEVEIRNGLPYFTMVGYLSKESMEAKERVASALRSIGHPLPSMKITVNLSPANIRKNGTAFDFPIAVAFLGCLNLIDASKLDDICIMGELGLNGKIRGVGNCLPIVLEARKQGIHKFFAASEDENSLRGIEDIEVVFMDSLQDVLDYFHGTYHQKSCRSATTYQKEESEEDFSDIIGQQHLKRAMEIAVTGRHHLLIIGSPGSGKTMAARRIPTILPQLSKEEKMEVQAIYDATGIPRYLEDDTRPFRQPHPMIPKAAFLGGGKTPTAGEITLAHHGILFLDEFMEFKTECIEALRQPLEDGTIDITRNGIYHKFPADFQLIATMNPCPCGYGLEDGICRCTYHERGGKFVGKWFRQILQGEHSLFRLSLPFRVRLFNVLALVGGMISLINGISSYANNQDSVILGLNLGIAVLSFVLLFYAYKSGRYQFCYVVTIIMIFLMMFPYLFFKSGGYKGGMVSFYIFGILFTVFMLEGKVMFFTAFMEMVVYSNDHDRLSKSADGCMVFL